jgi:transposase
MVASYLRDLRDRVVDADEKEDISWRAAALRFGVSESSACHMEAGRFIGSRAPAGTGRHLPSALKPHIAFLTRVLEVRPDITNLSCVCSNATHSDSL